WAPSRRLRRRCGGVGAVVADTRRVSVGVGLRCSLVDLRLPFCYLKFERLRVDRHQEISTPHILIVTHMNSENFAGNLGCDIYQVGSNIGVVGVSDVARQHLTSQECAEQAACKENEPAASTFDNRESTSVHGGAGL